MKNDIIPLQHEFIKISDNDKFDHKAICCFAATGFFLDNDTYYTNQKVLRPACEFENGVEKPYFKWHYSPRNISFNQAVDEFADLFEKISQEQIGNKKVILPLSGGLDSRTLAACLKGSENVFAYSYKFANTFFFDETKYGKQIAQKMRWNFAGYEIPNGYLWNKIEALAKINKCYSEFTNPRQMAIAAQFPEMGDIFLLGHGGDLFFDTMGVNPNISYSERLTEICKRIIRKGGLELGIYLWKAFGLSGNFETYLKEQIDNLLNSIYIENANSHLRAFKSMFYVNRWSTTNLSVFSHYHPVCVPYFDNRMCEFICTVPEEHLADRKIQIEYIKRKTPELAKIPWQSYDPCNLYNYPKYKNLHNQAIVNYRKVARKAVEIAIGKVNTERNWEIQFLGKENDENLKKWLFDNEKFNNFVPKELITHFYTKFAEGNHQQKVWYAHPLSMLLTLSLFANK